VRVMKKMTEEERRNPQFVMAVAMKTFEKYGFIKADCGHYILLADNKYVVERLGGQFFIFCSKCVQRR